LIDTPLYRERIHNILYTASEAWACPILDFRMGQKKGLLNSYKGNDILGTYAKNFDGNRLKLGGFRCILYI
jgi:hypothetical protein